MITTNGSYLPTIADFLAHWQQCNTALPPATPLLARLDQDVTVSRTQFEATGTALQNQITALHGSLVEQQIARGAVNLIKEKLLARLNQFIDFMEAYYQNTTFFAARPYAPSFSDGRDVFMGPLFDAMTLWEKMNASAPPAGVTLPVVLAKLPGQPVVMTLGEFSTVVSNLCFAYNEERAKAQNVTLARAKRNEVQAKAYDVMKAYRQAVEAMMKDFPTLIESLPRLTPLPGHTPEPVNASAVFEAPDKSKIVYDASTDGLLHRYQLRGCIGPDWDDDNSEAVATHLPNEPREFVTTFGLNQPGVMVVFKVYVILTTGNEAGSAPMAVQRPFEAVA